MSKTRNTFLPEMREQGVRFVLGNQGQNGSRWKTILSISSKVSCAPQTPNKWGIKAEVDSDKRAGISMVSCCRFGGHGCKSATKEPERQYDKTEV